MPEQDCAPHGSGLLSHHTGKFAMTHRSKEKRIVPRPLLLVLALGLFALAPPAQAQNFPSGTVRIIVPFPAGGATDVLGRVLSVHLQNLWGPPVVSEYRPGAAGLLGTRQVASSPADGYTLLMASTGAILALAGDRAGAGAFDITRELAPISLIAAPPYILVVNPSVPAKTAGELIAHARQNPGKVSFGSSGVGSASHLSGALFQQMAGIDMLHVPYRGTGPAVTDLLGGRIDVMFSPALTVTPHIAAGTLRVIGTTGAARSALFPDFPDRRRERACRLLVGRLVRSVRAGEYAARDRRQGQRRYQDRADVARRPAAACRAGRRARAEHARGLYRLRQCRHRQMARARAEGRHQAHAVMGNLRRAAKRSVPR